MSPRSFPRAFQPSTSCRYTLPWAILTFAFLPFRTYRPLLAGLGSPSHCLSGLTLGKSGDWHIPPGRSFSTLKRNSSDCPYLCGCLQVAGLRQGPRLASLSSSFGAADLLICGVCYMMFLRLRDRFSASICLWLAGSWHGST